MSCRKKIFWNAEKDKSWIWKTSAHQMLHTLNCTLGPLNLCWPLQESFSLTESQNRSGGGICCHNFILEGLNRLHTEYTSKRWSVFSWRMVKVKNYFETGRLLTTCFKFGKEESFWSSQTGWALNFMRSLVFIKCSQDFRFWPRIGKTPPPTRNGVAWWHLALWGNPAIPSL